MCKGEYITYVRSKKDINVYLQKLKGKELIMNFELDGKIILKCPLEKQCVRKLDQAVSGDCPVRSPLFTKMIGFSSFIEGGLVSVAD